MRRQRLFAVVFATSLATVPAWAGDPPGDASSNQPANQPANPIDQGANPIEPGRSPADADNTGRNVRDRSGETLTPMDQSNAPADLRITQSIRQAIVKEDGLSMDARNVKVITSNGIVTLRGPVDSEAERARIEALARGMSEVRRVDSQLEVDDSASTR